MTLPFTLPDWLPSWLALFLMAVVLVYALIFLLMPFSVFGLKSRLDAIEEQLHAVQDDLRTLALRVPGTRAYPARDEGLYDPAPRPPRMTEPSQRVPPIPPVPRPAVVRTADPGDTIRDTFREPARESVREPLREPMQEPQRGPLRDPPLREPLGRQRTQQPPRSTAPGRRIEPRLD